MTSKRKWVVLFAAVVCFAMVLGLVLLSIQPAPPPLQFTIVGRTNDPAGTPKVVVEVANGTPRTQNYTYWAEVQTLSGWAAATNWEPQHPGRLHWIKGRDTNRFVLPAPADAALWRLKFMREPQPTPLEWKRYALVRWTGLRRVGLREQPPRSYFFTDQLTE